MFTCFTFDHVELMGRIQRTAKTQQHFFPLNIHYKRGCQSGSKNAKQDSPFGFSSVRIRKGMLKAHDDSDGRKVISFATVRSPLRYAKGGKRRFKGTLHKSFNKFQPQRRILTIFLLKQIKKLLSKSQSQLRSFNPRSFISLNVFKAFLPVCICHSNGAIKAFLSYPC